MKFVLKKKYLPRIIIFGFKAGFKILVLYLGSAAVKANTNLPRIIMCVLFICAHYSSCSRCRSYSLVCVVRFSVYLMV
jgi:hypothetical protein